jgi:maltose O-acetyltransferase
MFCAGELRQRYSGARSQRMLAPALSNSKRASQLTALLGYADAMAANMHVKFRIANLLAGLLPDFGSGAIRAHLYRFVGLNIKDGVFIMGNIRLVSGLKGFYSKLSIGAESVIGDHVTINVDHEVRFGERVTISPYALIYTGTHQLGPGSMRRMPEVIGRPVVVEDGCWVGLGAIILPGVTIGHGSVVAAGAVVSTDIPPDSYVEGNPAVVVRQLPWGDR